MSSSCPEKFYNRKIYNPCPPAARTNPTTGKYTIRVLQLPAQVLKQENIHYTILVLQLPGQILDTGKFTILVLRQPGQIIKQEIIQSLSTSCLGLSLQGLYEDYTWGNIGIPRVPISFSSVDLIGYHRNSASSNFIQSIRSQLINQT